MATLQNAYWEMLMVHPKWSFVYLKLTTSQWIGSLGVSECQGSRSVVAIKCHTLCEPCSTASPVKSQVRNVRRHRNSLWRKYVQARNKILAELWRPEQTFVGGRVFQSLGPASRKGTAVKSFPCQWNSLLFANVQLLLDCNYLCLLICPSHC